MRIWFVLVLLLAVVPSLAGAAVINGVWICGVQYACGNSADGVCPTTYSPGDTCALCDSDCGVCACNGNLVCDGTETPGVCPLENCPVVRTATITFSPTSPSVNPNTPFTVTLTASTHPSLASMDLVFDALPAGVTLQAGSLSQTLAAGSNTNSITVTASAPGPYAFTGRVVDSQGLLVSPVATYTVTAANPPPQILAPTFVNVSVWPVAGLNGENVAYTFTITDDTVGASYSFNFGDGTSIGGTCAGLACTPTINHFYPAGTVYTAVVSATDSLGLTSAPTSYAPRTAVGLPIVYGTQTGNQTTQPNNNPAQCDANSCRQQVAGRWTCFSAFACSPNDATICAGVTSPPTFIPRDYDGNQVHCEAVASTSCTQYTWATVARQGWPGGQQMCIGDDAGEFINTNNLTLRTACQAAGMCYAAAGSNPSTQNRCYAPVDENTIATCTDGIDNNCNGVFDENELGCAAESVTGSIRFFDESGSPAPAPLTSTVSTTVSTAGDITPGIEWNCRTLSSDLGIGLDTQNPITTASYQEYYTACANQAGTSEADTVNFAIAGPPLGTRYVTVSSFGYEAQVIPITVAPNQRVDLGVITLSPTVCNADCTNRQGYCDRACIGVGACQPTDIEINTLNACHPAGAAYGLKPGQEVILGYDEAAGTANVGLCCSVVAQDRSAPKSAVTSDPAFGKIDTLVRYTSTVIINGRPYKLVINTW